MFKKILQISIVLIMCLGIISCGSVSSKSTVVIDDSIEKVSEAKIPNPFEDAPEKNGIDSESSVVIIYGEFIEEDSNL